jgi:hypothetical protein
MLFNPPRRRSPVPELPLLLLVVLGAGGFFLSGSWEAHWNRASKPIFIAAAILAILGICALLRALRETRNYNTVVYEPALGYYKTLRYCNRCDVIYDPLGRSAVAEDKGIADLLDRAGLRRDAFQYPQHETEADAPRYDAH